MCTINVVNTMLLSEVFIQPNTDNNIILIIISDVFHLLRPKFRNSLLKTPVYLILLMFIIRKHL